MVQQNSIEKLKILIKSKELEHEQYLREHQTWIYVGTVGVLGFLATLISSNSNLIQAGWILSIIIYLYADSKKVEMENRMQIVRTQLELLIKMIP